MIDIADKARLLKLIGMLGSTFDNERAVAASKIGDIAARYKLTINEAIAAAYGHAVPPPGKSAQPKHNPFAGDDMLQAVRALHEHYSRFLTPWERKFCEDVSARYGADYELTEKQVNVIERITQKVNRYTSNGREWGDV